MFTLNRIIEISPKAEGTWYIRILLDKDSAEHESVFLKVLSEEQPGVEKILPVIQKYLEIRNTPSEEQ